MTTTNGTPAPFRVEMTGPAETDFESTLDAAAAAGVGRAVVDAIGQIWRRLEHGPRDFGEPMYHLRAMKMEVRKAAIAPIYVEYGVHDDQLVVVIRRVRWLGNPSG